MKKTISGVIIMLILACNSILAGDVISKVGTTAAPFLEIGAGARAVAMGEAFTAIADEASAMYWNPAGISLLKTNQVSFNYMNWLVSMKYLYAGGVIRAGVYGSFGVSVTSLTTPEMTVRTVEEPEGLGIRYDAADLALGLTYARKLTQRFSFGATFKLIQRRIWHMSTNGIAFDFGVLYNLPVKNLKLGMSITNFGSKLQIQGVDAMVFTDIDQSKAGNNTSVLSHLRTKKWSLPIVFRFGLSYLIVNNKYNRIIIAGDFIHPNNNFESVNLGAEYCFMNTFVLRAGYKSLFLDNSEEGLTLGLGISYMNFRFDYSFMNMKHLQDIQQFSVIIKF
ncbi:PorV/PorQ family protein [Calditrichota bacterium LG25]